MPDQSKQAFAAWSLLSRTLSRTLPTWAVEIQQARARIRRAAKLPQVYGVGKGPRSGRTGR